MQCDPGCPLAEPEVWATVPGLPYQVSDYGQVRRLLADGSTRPVRTYRNARGYLRVGLGWEPCPPGCDRHKRARTRRRGHLRQPYVHRLIWAAFRGPIPDDLTVNHRDGSIRHNRLGNLELMTRSENSADQWIRWRATESEYAA